MWRWLGEHWRDVLAVLGFLVTLIGFWIAIQQIRKATSAAEAGEKAISKTAERLGMNYLLILLSQLQDAQQALALAVARDEGPSAQLALLRWRQLSGQARGRLAATGEHQEVVKLIQASVAQIGTAQAMIDKDEKSVADATKRVRAAIDRASDELSALMAQLAMDPGATHD